MKIREKEARNSAKLIGAGSFSLNIPDGELFPNMENRLKMLEMIRLAKADLIITHSPDDYMSDHTATSQLVTEASFYTRDPGFKVRAEMYQTIPPIFFMDTLAGVNFQPTEYVDVSETIGMKKKMLALHESQLKWLLDSEGIDILASVDTVARFRGLQASVKYAEGSRQYQVWPRNVTRRLLP